MRSLKCQYVREKVPAAVFNYDKLHKVKKKSSPRPLSGCVVWSQRHMLSKLLFIHHLWFTSNMTWTWHRTTIFRSRSNFKTSKSTVGMPKTHPPQPKILDSPGKRDQPRSDMWIRSSKTIQKCHGGRRDPTCKFLFPFTSKQSTETPNMSWAMS